MKITAGMLRKIIAEEVCRVVARAANAHADKKSAAALRRR